MKPVYLWWNYYQAIRDESWPDCVNEHEFYGLHPLIQHEILKTFNGHDHIDIDPQHIIEYSQHTDFRMALDPVDLSDDHHGPVDLDLSFRVSRDWSVLYNHSLDGQGALYCQFFPRVLRYLYPGRVFDDGLEWCSGAGFIGFRLLSDGIVKNIAMMDRHLPALTACNTTWQTRPDRLHSAGFETVHGSQVSVLGARKFDLIVANPPNFDDSMQSRGGSRHRLTQDPDWMIHDDFFRHISANLKPNGVILLIKNIHGSQPLDHIDVIQRSGLRINRVFTYAQQEYEYYLEVVPA
jgi:hypothetical protein